MRLSNVLLPIALVSCLLGCDSSQDQKKTKALNSHEINAIDQVKSMVYVRNRDGLVFAVTNGGYPSCTITYIQHGDDIIPASKILSVSDRPD